MEVFKIARAVYLNILDLMTHEKAKKSFPAWSFFQKPMGHNEDRDRDQFEIIPKPQHILGGLEKFARRKYQSHLLQQGDRRDSRNKCRN